MIGGQPWIPSSTSASRRGTVAEGRFAVAASPRPLQPEQPLRGACRFSGPPSPDAEGTVEDPEPSPTRGG